MRRKLDTAFLCGATLLAVAIECAILGWLWHTVWFRADPDALYRGNWLAPLLPQAWLIGLTASMIHRLVPVIYEREKTFIHRRHLRRLAFSFLALASIEDCMLWIPLARVIR